MMLGIDEKELFHTIEALLFVAGEPVSINKLADVLEIPEEQLMEVMPKMMDEYNFDRRGIKMIRLDNSFQLTTRPEYFEQVVKLVTHKHKQSLSASTLEVLSIISYNQPITKAAIEKVRGVDSSYSLTKLLERDLIEQKGRLNAPGKPLLYGTTDEFLRCFGLQSLEDMPDLDVETIGFDMEPESDNVSFDDLTAETTGEQAEEQANDAAHQADEPQEKAGT